ncbi:MAG TPA: 2-oxoglutarate and iron-dependent oxygenase domain-containing protein [Aquihabitans sp.]|jgi:isopenicillin N synthase-like dioxygenase|nr:2-oxoglutarate and iron-dependent oxygenase domain-containing protein [Aquihabitans sp.]
MPDLAVHPVDLEPFRHGGPAEREAVARRIDLACRDTGFLVLTGHGVPATIVDRWMDACGEFFALPIEEKRRWIVADPAANCGYTELGQEGLAYTLGEATPPDLFEAITFGREDAVGPTFDAMRRYFHPNVWPDRPAGLRDAFLDYEAHLRELSHVVLRAMELALDLPPEWLVERNRDAVITTRAINYERAEGAPDPVPGQMRLGAHSDYGVLTLLAADDVPGLEIRRDGRWHPVSPPPGTFIGNIGDLLGRWTNDRWRSTQHRVVPPPAGTGPVRRRSVARFMDGDPSLTVECIPSCVSAEHPARYGPVNAGEWLVAKIVGGRTRALVDQG